MHTFKKTLVAAALVSAGAAAQAEVSGSVAIASSYLWRGLDLGYGSAVVSGSLDYAHESGIYAGIWGSSGDDSYGTEYDLYVGWGGEVFEGFSVDLGYVDYNYPDLLGATDFEEVILGLSYGPVSFTFVEPTTDGAEYNYYALGYGISDFSFTYGWWEENGGEFSHLDATYSMGDLSFTLSQSFDKGIMFSDDPASEELQFVVSYSIPLD